MPKQLLSGNEAIALGAWEAGVRLGVGYPGTPSTETLENLVGYEGVHCEWLPNEKVALETALGGSVGGARSFATMKHVGLNVAADPFMSATNTGVTGGLVILVADDPSCYSSQNEQDSRYYAAFARVPCLDPSDSQEAYEMARAAWDISERFDTPVMLHETMRIAHTKTLVDAAGQRAEHEPAPYQSQANKYVMMPAFAVRRRAEKDRLCDEMAAWADETELNRVELRDRSVGIVVAGALYQHVREALPDASVLKLGVTWPLPACTVRDFAAQVDKLYVVEETCTYFTDAVRAMGVEVATPPAGPLPRAGEIAPAQIRAAFGLATPEHAAAADDLPGRPPTFCAGCPHRLVFTELRRMKAIVTGDIGCYTLGAGAPFRAVDTVIDMGASLSMAHGMELAGAGEATSRPVIGVIGDSTFAHSGITSLLGTVYNGGTGTLCILDNRTTAMTGAQGNPCNGITLAEQAAGANPLKPLDNPAGKALDLVALCQAIGVDEVEQVDAQDLREVRRALKEAVAHTDKLSVIIFKSPCRLIDRSRVAAPTITDCRTCGACIQIGCPALGRDAEGHAQIDVSQCIGCGQCVQVCPFKCIQFAAPAAPAAAQPSAPAAPAAARPSAPAAAPRPADSPKEA